MHVTSWRATNMIPHSICAAWDFHVGKKEPCGASADER
jgi:hypothetical protein